MARQKQQNKPRHVSIHLEHLMFDIDLMSNEQAGIILKMIVWYSAGTEESLSHLEEMKKYIDTLPEKGWLTGMYQRLFSGIDEDLQNYAEKCEKQKKRIQDYWDKKNAEAKLVNDGTPRNTTENDGIPTNTDENDGTPRNTTENDGIPTNTNTIRYDTIRYDIPNGMDNNIKQQQEQQDARARKKKNLPKAKIKDFRKLWNNICNDFKERQQPCRLKFIKPGDLPGDAEERLNKVLREIYGGLTQEVANDVLDLYGCKTEEGRTMENAAKDYLVRAIENMAAVKMKMEDTSFGSFQWLMKSPERIRKMYDRDIQ